MSGTNLTEGGRKHPPPSAAPGGRSPVLLGLSDKTKIVLFSNLSHFYFDLRPPGQDRGAKTRPQGQLGNANPRESPGGMIRLGID